MKTIINVFGKGDIGKSSAIKAAYAKLTKKQIDLKDYVDIRETVSIDGVTIALASAGDNYEEVNRNIEFFDKKDNCSVFVCASRTKGGTIGLITNYAKENGYLLIEMSPCTYDRNSNTDLVDILTDINSDTIVNLIYKLIELEK